MFKIWAESHLVLVYYNASPSLMIYTNRDQGGKCCRKPEANGEANGAAESCWVPVMLGMGLPLFPDKLCIAVCGRAGASKFLEVRESSHCPTWAGLAQWVTGT